MPSLKHTQKEKAVEKLIIFMNFYPAPLFTYCWLGWAVILETIKLMFFTF